MPQHAFKKSFCVLTLMFFAVSLFSYAAEQSGTVRSGNTRIRFSSVTLYSAGSSQNALPVVLGSSQTKANGSFSIAFTPPSDARAILYLIADGGLPASSTSGNHFSSAIRMATVLGPAAIPAGVVINERTTVAAAYAMAQFISGSSIAGTSPGLQNAFATMLNLVDPITGEVGSVLGKCSQRVTDIDNARIQLAGKPAGVLRECRHAGTLQLAIRFGNAARRDGTAKYTASSHQYRPLPSAARGPAVSALKAAGSIRSIIAPASRCMDIGDRLRGEWS